MDINGFPDILCVLAKMLIACITEFNSRVLLGIGRPCWALVFAEEFVFACFTLFAAFNRR